MSTSDFYRRLGREGKEIKLDEKQEEKLQELANKIIESKPEELDFQKIPASKITSFAEDFGISEEQVKKLSPLILGYFTTHEITTVPNFEQLQRLSEMVETGWNSIIEAKMKELAQKIIVYESKQELDHEDPTLPKLLATKFGLENEEQLIQLSLDEKLLIYCFEDQLQPMPVRHLEILNEKIKDFYYADTDEEDEVPEVPTTPRSLRG